MPASKQAHVLAVMRKNLSLKQSELAELAGCSVASIQSIELNRLKLSKSMAARISNRTGVNFDWLLKNNVTVPMPPRPLFTEGVTRPLQDYVCTICLLAAVFSRLFAAARRLKSTGARQSLELLIAEELDALKKTEHDPKAKPLNPTSREVFQFFDEHPTALDHDLEALLDLNYLIATAQPQSEIEQTKAQPARLDSKKSKDRETESPKVRKARFRNRQLA
jgi:transcriptional regulator with XRE-family HTH domain